MCSSGLKVKVDKIVSELSLTLGTFILRIKVKIAFVIHEEYIT